MSFLTGSGLKFRCLWNFGRVIRFCESLARISPCGRTFAVPCFHGLRFNFCFPRSIFVRLESIPYTRSSSLPMSNIILTAVCRQDYRCTVCLSLQCPASSISASSISLQRITQPGHAATSRPERSEKNNEHVVRSVRPPRNPRRERESRSNAVTIMHIQGVDLFNFRDQGRAPVARAVILDRLSRAGRQISFDVTPLATSSLIMHNYAPTGAYIHLRSYYFRDF